MPSTATFVRNRPDLVCYEAGPGEVGIEDVDCQTTGTTAGNVLVPAGAGRIHVLSKTVIAGGTPTAGSYKVHLELLDENDNVIELLASSANSIFLVSQLSPAGTYWGCFSWQMNPIAAPQGQGLTLTEWGAVGGDTIQDDIKFLRKIRLSLEVTAAYDVATSVLASIYAQWC